MNMIPLTKPYFNDQEFQNVKQVLDSGWVAQGNMVKEFENAVAKHENCKFAVATSSCTTALHLALIVNDIGQGDDVLVPAFTFVATANAVEYTGATPILVDVEAETYNISPQDIEKVIEKSYALDQETGRLVNRKTENILKAILVVHQFGLCADMKKINRIRDRFGITVIEDAACGLGAHISGIHQGSFGNISCVSFHPRKCITTGEGGMVFTNSEQQYLLLCQLRSHGAAVSEISRHQNKGGYLLPSFGEVGYNYRMSDIQGGVGLAQIDKLDFILDARRKSAKKYSELLQDVRWLVCPKEPQNYFHTYQSYVCMLKVSERHNEQLRNRIMMALDEAGIQTRQGTHAIHMLDFYKNTYGYSEDDFPNAKNADKLSISLPLYVDIKADEQEYVVNKLMEIYREEVTNV